MRTWPLYQLSEKLLDQEYDLTENTNILTLMINSLENMSHPSIAIERQRLLELEKESPLDYLFTRR